MFPTHTQRSLSAVTGFHIQGTGLLWPISWGTEDSGTSSYLSDYATYQELARFNVPE